MVCYLLAIDKIPAPVCFRSLWISSSNNGLKIEQRRVLEGFSVTAFGANFDCYSCWGTQISKQLYNMLLLGQGNNMMETVNN